MSLQMTSYVRFGAAISVIVLSLSYLAYTGIEQSKSYYVTIRELRGMDNDVYSKRLRVAGHVAAGSIKRQGSRVEFTLEEQGELLPVVYVGTEVPPDTFTDGSEALAEGEFGRDGVFHARKLQAKCASKYDAAQPGAPGAPAQTTQNAPAAPSYTPTQ